ncbi:DUF4340 domain-containing protein [Pelagicoccus sp. NFK12]|uniref:DUF4340 domain-containing protein n=1 Tax=Pelagicoccus enzymogenes TaxID=2773457 RepID=A0A927F7V2_9BACT|nr:DUF4340 domain-containing protein [Pelagicoccus enzymogenes]MBD5778775.1 DUF4340 domain-containing protein [Pelagicoccus enzymogenes]MDQ8197478.1 DUF4340 domain-containing protein [Pelagicoccus enzymogenes]
MRLKLTLTLLAILLGLLTYIFYIDNRTDSGEYEDQRSSVLGDLAVGIDYLSIQNNATGQNITLQQSNNRWMLREPYLWPANEFAVQRILTELRFLERISSFETNIVSNSGVSLPDYGLKPSQFAIMIGRGDKRSTLHIGKPTEIGNNLYILSTDQSHVHVVNRSLLDSISVNLDDLRSSRLFDIAVFEATSWNIQVREDGRNLRAWFARNGDSWVFETPIRARADSEAVNVLLNRCLSLEADSIVASNPTDLSPYGLQNPLYRIAIESDQDREVLEIGEKISPDSEFRYAKRESRPTVFQLRIEFLELLANSQTMLRERRIFEVDVTAATTVTIERRDELPLTLQKLEDGTWELVVRDENQGIQTMDGDANAITEILQWLDELKAVPDDGFVNDAPSAPDLESYGLEVPEYTITVTSNRLYGKAEPLPELRTETLLIGDRTPDDRHESFIKIASKDFVYSSYNDIFSQIDNDPLRYKNRNIISLPDSTRIQKITIERLSDRTIIAEQTIDPAAETPSPEAKLAAVVSQLTVHSFHPEGFTRTVEIAGRRRPWAYKLVATVGTEDTENAITQLIEIYVSETTGGPLLWGGISQTNQGFRFGTEFIDSFSDIVFDRVAREAPEQPFSTKPLPDGQSTGRPSSENQFEAATPVQPSETTE